MCERVFHERATALKVCVPTAAFAVFFLILAIVLILNATSDDALTPRDCQVLRKDAYEAPGNPGKYQATVHVALVGQFSSQQITRYRNPADWEVELTDAQQYVSRFQVGSVVTCYQFEDGALQLDESEYTSAWVYVIVVVALLSACLCCCVWLSSAVFACCSPNLQLE